MRLTALNSFFALVLSANMSAADTALNFEQQLVSDARAQIGVTTIYDPSYVGLNFPMGDIDRERGVCTDVVIRALRDTAGVDLQALVNTDMKQDFSSYPTTWGLTRTDKNIDHRRVPNLEVFFERMNAALPLGDGASSFVAGDIVTWRLPGNLPHIGIISDTRLANGTPLVIHNIGAGTQEEDILFRFKMIGHYRPTAAHFK